MYNMDKKTSANPSCQNQLISAYKSLIPVDYPYFNSSCLVVWCTFVLTGNEIMECWYVCTQTIPNK